MQLLQKYINSKTGDMSICEDAVVLTDHFASVIDGATSKSTMLFDGKKGGRMASEIAAKAIESFPPDISAEEAYISINQSIIDLYKKENIFEHMRTNAQDRCTVSVLIYSNFHKELWFIGDCQALVGDSLINNIKKVDTLFEDLRAFYLEYELLKGKTINELLEHDTAREVVISFIEKQMSFQNTPKSSDYAFTVIDGFFTDVSSIKKISIPEYTKYLVLASDGYPKLYPTLEESEQALAEIIKKDPLCFRDFKSTKGVVKGNISFDDRSYIKFSI